MPVTAAGAWSNLATWPATRASPRPSPPARLELQHPIGIAQGHFDPGDNPAALPARLGQSGDRCQRGRPYFSMAGYAVRNTIYATLSLWAWATTCRARVTPRPG